ncbi:MAG: 50S ribosomal protein L6 [Firmicutes bacterium RBG_13_65_8]|nr:MAG: 50S ribosomal protein L6 [Firmicutes bacterium RBG_13_65_8]
MSRVGRKPISLPAGVSVRVEGSAVTVAGPNGTLRRDVHPEMSVALEGNEITVSRPSDSRQHRSLHGLTRTLVANMVQGVTAGFRRNLEIVGVGYRASKQGRKLVLSVGFSHPVEILPPEGVEIEVPNPNAVAVSGADKEKVGQTAADIRAVRPPEPYKGKGIRYEGEVVRRKAGKVGK